MRIRFFCYIVLSLFLLINACTRRPPEVREKRVSGCLITCPVGYECDENDNRCVPLPHSFTCMNSCPSDRYCSASGECKPNPVFCQMGQVPTRCTSTADCYAGQTCINSYCFYPPCKCNSNADCDALNQICNNGVCDCFELGCKSDEDCSENQICVKNYPLCGQCVPKS